MPGTGPSPAPHRPRARIYGAATGGALALLLLLVLSGHSSGSRQEGTTPRPLPSAVSATELAAKSGVRVTRVAATGGGGLLDVRYEVVNPEAAASLHDEATPPALVDEGSGLVIGQLFMGHLHSGPTKPGLSYSILFMNPGDAVRRGDRVSVVLGDARLEHVPVL